jgi:hypothetical protein
MTWGKHSEPWTFKQYSHSSSRIYEFLKVLQSLDAPKVHLCKWRKSLGRLNALGSWERSSGNWKIEVLSSGLNILMCVWGTPHMARNGPYYSAALPPLSAQHTTPFTEPSNNLLQKQVTRACHLLRYTTSSSSQSAEGGDLPYAQVDVLRSV